MTVCPAIERAAALRDRIRALTEEGRDALARVAAVIRDRPGRFLVAGHTDDVPVGATPRYSSNRELSIKRAAAVLSVLEASGVDKHLLSHLGYGEFLPDSENESDIGRAANRRIELILLPRLSEVPLFPSEL